MEFQTKGPLKDNIYNLMRRIGYRFWGKNETTGESNFIRSLDAKDSYPRFHLYLKQEDGGDLLFNLHLDQKRAIYKGVSAHSGEYEGELVEKEEERIEKIINGD